MRLHSDLDLPTISLFILLISSGVNGLHGGVNLSLIQIIPHTKRMPKIISIGIFDPFSIFEGDSSLCCGQYAVEAFLATSGEICPTIDFLHLLEHFP